MMRYPRWSLLFTLPAGCLIGLFLLGLGQLLLSAFFVDGRWDASLLLEILARPDQVAMLVRTIVIALATTLLSLLLGYPVAYLIARSEHHRNHLLLLVILPWLVSVVVRTYGWMVILGPKGLINSALQWSGLVDSPLPFMYHGGTVVLGLVHVLCPFMILAILAALLKVEPALEEASADLGASEWVTLRVLLPLSLPGMLTGVMLVWLMSVGAIVTPLMLGGLKDTLIGSEIFQQVLHFFDYRKAATFASLLMVVAILGVLPLQWLERRLSLQLRDA